MLAAVILLINLLINWVQLQVKYVGYLSIIVIFSDDFAGKMAVKTKYGLGGLVLRTFICYPQHSNENQEHFPPNSSQSHSDVLL
jgi:hypothetical protein